MTKDKYESLIKVLDMQLKFVNSKQKDNLIRQHIKEIYPSSTLFSDNQKSFFEFVFSLKT